MLMAETPLRMAEEAIQKFNEKAAKLKEERDELAVQLKADGLGTRFVQRYLASITVRMPSVE